MASKAARLLVVLAAVIATGSADLAAQQTASQLVTVRHASGQGVSPVYEGFDINPDGSFNMRVGFERKAKPASTSSVQNR